MVNVMRYLVKNYDNWCKYFLFHFLKLLFGEKIRLKNRNPTIVDSQVNNDYIYVRIRIRTPKLFSFSLMKKQWIVFVSICRRGCQLQCIEGFEAGCFSLLIQDCHSFSNNLCNFIIDLCAIHESKFLFTKSL